MSPRLLPSMKGAAATTIALAAALSACDTIYADPVTAPFPSRSSGVPDSGLTSPRTSPITCSEPPQENGPCVLQGGVCEVGTSPDKRCNTIFVCVGDVSLRQSYWTEQTPPRCPTACPDPSQIVDGAPCDVGDAGGDEAELHCSTPIGTCACTTGRDGAHAHPRRWVCTTPPVGCPEERPLLGAPCSGARSCDYGACTSKQGMSMICEQDTWQTEVAACE